MIVFFNLGCTNDNRAKESSSLKLKVTDKVVVLLAESKNALDRGDFQVALSLIDSTEQYVPNYIGIHFINIHIVTITIDMTNM